jgi:hypothetical protein
VPRLITSDFVSLAYTIGLLVAVSGFLFALYRLFTQLISAVMLWMLLGLTLVGCYSYQSELYDAGKWLFAEAAPAPAIPHGVTVKASVLARENCNPRRGHREDCDAGARPSRKSTSS